MSVPIPKQTRIEVRARSGGRCERCKKFRAVHMHHLTYECGPNALPEHIQHICMMCHMDLHPGKAFDIRDFELNRPGGYSEEEYWGERQDHDEQESRKEAERKYRQQQMWERMQEARCEEREGEPEAAWNLGGYSASGYCLDDVEREESDRGIAPV